MTSVKKEGIEGLNKTVTVKFPKGPKDLKELAAGMRMIGWSLAAGTCVFFLDKAVNDFDKLTTPQVKKQVKKPVEKKIEVKEGLNK